jgi:multiple sugar transport system substrate-binding protein
MPSFDPGGSHETIAGPDNWVIFDNGPERVAAAWAFLSWFTAPDQVLKDSMTTGHLPTRASVPGMPGFADFNTKYPGVGTFVDNLENVKKARPQVPQYPRVSTVLGQAVVNVLLGKGTPQENLDAAATQADGFLAVPA